MVYMFHIGLRNKDFLELFNQIIERLFTLPGSVTVIKKGETL